MCIAYTFKKNNLKLALMPLMGEGGGSGDSIRNSTLLTFNCVSVPRIRHQFSGELEGPFVAGKIYLLRYG